MDDLNKILLQRLSEDDKMLEAIRIELLSSLDYRNLNMELNNVNLGAEVRAMEKAKDLVEEGLRNIKKLKANQKVGNQDANPGR